MDIDKIKALAEILAAQNLSLIEVCEGDHKIRLEKDCGCLSPAPSQQQTQLPAPPALPLSVGDGQQAVDFNKLIEIKSPLVGIFYAAAAPDAEPFV
ncbi:MAG: acetyl-CoA carboxylase biotin carboxyl carrier protein, partial [Clostridia bacterium]|nr:acetyl-CoA carboxylase biotin carboxyl carrier protein [Clostridia bacterium]